MEKIDGGVTAAKGFLAAHTAAGIKYQGRDDMAMIYSKVPAVAAGTFTRNVVKAAPVKWDQQVVGESPFVQAVVMMPGSPMPVPDRKAWAIVRRRLTRQDLHLGSRVRQS